MNVDKSKYVEWIYRLKARDLLSISSLPFGNLWFFFCWILLLNKPVSAQMATPPLPPGEVIPTPSPSPMGLEMGTSASFNSSQEIEVGGSYESLTNNFADWQSSYILGRQSWGDGTVLYGTIQQTQRFSLTDAELMLGVSTPLGEDRRWRVGVEGSLSPTHQVLPQWSVGGQVERSLDDGWNLQVGYRRTQFNNAEVDRENLTVERYFGDYRIAYTLALTQVAGAGSGSSHSLQANYYYGDRSNIGLLLAMGQEVESLGFERVLTSNVRAVAFSGQHWFDPNWGLTYNLTLQDQGDLYTRRGLQVGIRHRF